MAPKKKSILIVAHDGNLLQTRKMLLEHAGYTVAAVVSDDEAMTLLETEVFDLILLGRASKIQELGLDPAAKREVSEPAYLEDTARRRHRQHLPITHNGRCASTRRGHAEGNAKPISFTR
jgi:hypothetical protein